MNRILILIILVCNLSFGQAPMDGPFVSERFQVYNGLVNFKIWSIGDFLVMNSNQFDLELADVNFIKNENINQFEANYLFQEESHWVKRLYRTLIFASHPINKGVEVVKTSKGIVSLGEFIQSNLNNNQLLFFKDNGFTNSITSDQLNTKELSQIIGVKFKQDFAYNRMTNSLEVYISGFAPIVKEASGSYKELFWFNYGNFKGETGAQGAKSLLLNNLKEGKFKASVDKIENSIMKGVVDRSYQNDLDALVRLKLLEEKLALTPEIYRKEGGFKIRGEEEEIKGEVQKGVLHGSVSVKHNSKGVVLEVMFKNGTPEGKYVVYHSKGKIKEEGSFEAGLRVGTWSTYFTNGKLGSRKEYVSGFLSGQQDLYYENGNIRDRYVFENNLLSGPFESYYADGVVKAKGNVVNGLVSGNWKYSIRLAQNYLNIIAKNPTYWDSHFKVVKGWSSEAIKKGQLSLSVQYDHQPGENCLNQLCPKMTVVDAGN